LKQGELGHEDEKFSYVAATRLSSEKAKARIVRHPQRFSGFTKLQLCTPEGLQQVTVTRSQKEKYRAVKRADWGSAWKD
jgi:ribosomal protein RSM22 (predicted rRNA methylase)